MIMSMENRQTLIGHGVIIAGVSTYAYFLAFMYEFGYSTYYSLPAEFISVELESVFIAFVALGSLVFTTYFIVDSLIRPFLINEKNAVKRRIGSYILVLTFILFPLFITGNKVDWRIMLFLVPMLLVDFVLPLRFRSEESYEKKFERQNKLDDTVGDNLLDKVVESYFGKWGMAIVFIMFYIAWLSYIGGGFKGRIQSEFLVANVNGKESILLKKDGSQLIFSPIFDSSRIEKKFYLVPLSNISDNEIRVIKIKHLNIEK